jgi:hypothetical protein
MCLRRLRIGTTPTVVLNPLAITHGCSTFKTLIQRWWRNCHQRSKEKYRGGSIHRSTQARRDVVLQFLRTSHPRGLRYVDMLVLDCLFFTLLHTTQQPSSVYCNCKIWRCSGSPCDEQLDGTSVNIKFIWVKDGNMNINVCANGYLS